MVQRNTNRRKRRNSRRMNPQLEFGKLEDRKMMAADMVHQPTLADSAGVDIVQHAMQHHADPSIPMAAINHCGSQHNNPALMALVSDAAATHVAIGSGDWSNSATWQNGIIPSAGARVIIPANQTVTVDQVFNEEFKTIRIDGTLKFATDVNTQLKVDTLVSTHCGRLEIGTTANPVQSNVTAKVIFADDGAIDVNWDPTQISRGAILMGTTELHGAETTDKVILATQPRAGDTQIQLSVAPTNWKAGDQIVITGTQGATSDEVRTIASITGTTVRFDQALTMDHVTPKESLNVYVANKTRNIEFRSENASIARRGHIMLAHTHNVNINHAGFYDLGRTDKSKDLDDVQFEFTEDAVGNEAGAPIVYTFETNPQANNIRGRYALHFHRGGVDPNSTPATVNGSVVDGSPGWGFVNHSSHVNFKSNVAYGVWGSAYYTEAGDEVGTFDGNIAIRSVNPRDPVDPESREIATDLGHGQQEFGNSGDGFWLSGHLVSLKNNISSGNSGHGIIIWSDGLVEHDLGDESGRTTVKTANFANGNLITGRTEVPVWWAPLAEISNNEVSNAVIGFRTRYIHSKGYLGEGGSAFHRTPDQAYVDTLNPVVDGLKVWGCREGVMLNYSERMSLKNAEIIGTGEAFVNQAGTTNVGVGLDLGNDISRGSGRLENVKIEGFGLGVFAPRNEQWVIDNLDLRNTTDFLLTKPTLSPRTLTMSNVSFGSLDGTAVAGTENQRRNIVFLAPEFTEFVGQPFGFLMPDQITIDGQQIYADYQNQNYVPLPEEPEGNDIANVPSSWVGRTNQQLQNLIGMSTSGNITPAGSQNVSWINGGSLGPLSPAVTRFPQLFDMTNGGFSPEPFPGGPVPELTGNRVEIDRGETVVFMNTNLNTTDTDTGIANLTYTVSQEQNGYFAHRDAPTTPVSSFTQADVNGGVIRFVHDGTDIAPTYRVRVTDGTTTTPWSQATVIFNGNGGNQNRPPVANDDSAATATNQSVQIAVLNNDTDPDGDRLMVQSFEQPTHGSVTNNNGVLTYTPTNNFSGTDSFSYVINDGNGNVDTARVTVSVTNDNGNSPPIAVDDQASGNEDASISIPVLQNDTDPDGDSLSIDSFGQPDNGSVVNNNGILAYTPNPNFYGSDSFVYSIHDGNGNTASAAVALTINPVNDNPVANDDSASTPHNTPVSIEVLDNDTDVDGDNLSVESFSQASNGSVTNSNGNLTYTPNPGFMGTDSFTYAVTDGSLGDTATVQIEVAQDTNSDADEIGYSGTVRVNHRWTTVTLPQAFEDPVVVAGGASRNGGHPGVVRVRNVTSDSFEIRFQEWDYLDGRHAFEDIGYLVVESGTHELTDGTKIVAGKLDLIHERVDSVEFSDDFVDVPVVISQLMTNNGRAAVTDRLREVSESGFEIQMSEEEAADHRHNRETVGWIAMEQGSADSGMSNLTALLVDDIDHRTTVVEFGDLGTTSPIVLTDIQTRHGGDNATVRHRGQTDQTVSIFLEEEQSADDEVRHIGETVGLVAFESGMLVAKSNSGLNSANEVESSLESQPNAAMAISVAQPFGHSTLSGSMMSVRENGPDQIFNMRGRSLQLAASLRLNDVANDVTFLTETELTGSNRKFDVELDAESNEEESFEFDSLDEVFSDFDSFELD